MYTYGTSAKKVEKVATYDYWKQYEKKRKAKKRTKNIKKIAGFALVASGLAIPFLWNVETFASVALVLSWVLMACIIAFLILGLVASGLLLIGGK